MFNLWKPIVPDGHRRHLGAGDRETPGRNRRGTSTATTPGSACCSARRSSACGTGAPISTSSSGRWARKNETEARRGYDLRGVPQAVAGVRLHHPRHDRVRAGARAARRRRCRPWWTRTAMPSRRGAQAAFPLMVQHVLPTGVRGIVVAGLLAALMSSLAGVFNASSTLFTMDLYQKSRPRASQAQLVWVGRMATVAMVLIGIAWIPVIQGATRPLRLPAGRAGLPGPADLRRVLPRRVLETAQRRGLHGGAGRRFRAGVVPARRRHAGQPRARRLSRTGTRRDRCCGSSTTSTSSTTAC